MVLSTGHLHVRTFKIVASWGSQGWLLSHTLISVSSAVLTKRLQARRPVTTEPGQAYEKERKGGASKSPVMQPTHALCLPRKGPIRRGVRVSANNSKKNNWISSKRHERSSPPY